MDKVFVLDIGTRVVIGLLMQKSDNGYEILASARAEHTQRAMYDGQVHDVDEVAKAVLQIKKELEQKSGLKLNKVAVAAAGRALCTETAKVSREEAIPMHWERQDILSLEMEAVQQAMSKTFSAEMDSSLLYCVGYSTVKQLLEEQPLTSLVGQRGKKVELTVVATFLPRSVVDGLVAVLERAGLEMASLTLEPIAAGQAAIPMDMRRLNLALVDIGAGTADIALTRDGSFFSYGMVPIAGDEVTEPICSHYLLDFSEGERIKRELNNNEEVEIVSFFGEKITVPVKDVLEIITPTVKNMAERIAQEILSLNKAKPQAVILVGGGSLTPLLPDFLSKIMEIPRNRIGIQVRERMQNISGEEDCLKGSDVITPIGIGMTALDGNGLHYYSVMVNDMNIPIFELQLATVAEALLSAGTQPRTFLGRPGAALVYNLNGEMKVIKGGLGSPAQISVNGQPARLEQQLHPNDCVKFVPGYSGTNAKAQLKDVVAFTSGIRVFFNGIEEEFGRVIYLNNKAAKPEDWLEDGCSIVIQDNKTLYDLLKLKGFGTTKVSAKTIKVQGKPREVLSDIKIMVNGQIANEDCLLQDQDKIELTEKKITIKDLDIKADPMIFIVNEEEFLLAPQEEKIFSKGRLLSPDDVVQDGMELRVEGFSRKPILSELFPYLNLQEKVIPGGKLKMLVNGNKAEFTTELNQGDRIIVKWEEPIS